MVQYVPVMLNCEGKSCLIIGGGPVAERKAETLIEAGAAVHIISPNLSGRLISLAEEGVVRWTCREYREGDLEGAFLVYAASFPPEVNGKVAAEARRLGIMVNVASDGESGDFISPAVLRRGRLTVAVSTAGAGPAAAVNLCRRLEEELGDEFEMYLDFLHELRVAVKEKVRSQTARRKLLRKIVEIDILQDIRRGDFIPWSPEQIDQWITHNQEE
ncbi:precorrin-2 dehydrogenase/sirohydrochlorin ferrochelatase family protein [Paenibacillus sp. DMB20]|uniref:precorrin-2 dehydrogenase/sirohydrochlorin ferrochelatase family protein n=1 Tax=Paenibacillus sp. DMB20 TaxID=1642570 RepID=UPI000627D945|nr:NAD(P)-dependent oxidoreductase [Paenibacillus sp. DMB20]KKO51325.1 siroheme synthase [Paenibacillus sp. DMB20]KKO51841.1 siroheme synthase [Paenibacillus sp. DMB20]